MTEQEKKLSMIAGGIALAGVVLAAMSSKGGRARFRGFALRARARFGGFRRRVGAWRRARRMRRSFRRGRR